MSVADFLVEPRRGSILRRFPGFPRADVEDALLFAYEQSLGGKCRERDEFSIRAWLRQVMLRELVHQAERRAQVGLAARDEVDFDLVADARPGPEQQLLTSERCEAVRALLDELPERAALVAELHYFEELSYAEIGARTGFSARQIKRDLRRVTDAVQEWMLSRSGSRPCEFGRKSVLLYARGEAYGRAAEAQRHLEACERCRAFYTEFRAMRWGAAALAPYGAVAQPGGTSPLAALAERATAAAQWVKQHAYALAGRADATPFAAVRPGAAATAVTCLALGTGGGAPAAGAPTSMCRLSMSRRRFRRG